MGPCKKHVFAKEGMREEGVPVVVLSLFSKKSMVFPFGFVVLHCGCARSCKAKGQSKRSKGLPKRNFGILDCKSIESLLLDFQE